jgi:DNA excision repair protein ERCC-5
VDGIVTDDSDTFLFGGDKVYKNMFNQSKFVEYYVMSDIERQLGLDRQKLIQMAHLLGSDYTPGISGVGNVNSLEILNRFSDLEAFKQWWQSIQTNPTLTISIKDKALKNLCQRIDVPQNFPDPRVREAYLKPTIDESTESFEWGHVDLDALRDYLEERLSWPALKTDQHVLPAIKEMNKRATEGSQMTLDHFIRIERPIKASQRIQKAVQKMKRL